jgi:hypothetical protein
MNYVRCAGLFLLCVCSALARTVDIQIYPPVVKVEAGGAAQTILVAATNEEGVTRDVTAEATLRAAKPGTVRVNGSHAVEGLAPGRTVLEAVFDGNQTSIPITVEPSRPHPFSFVNDIVPIFTKADCANANCHGSVRGQKGFKLSLFGYEPELDYKAITKLSDGRRVDLKNPENSLLLKKPTFQVPHGGGLRFKIGSPEYQAMLEWLKRGAPFDQPGLPRITSLSVYPQRWRLVGLGSKVQLIAVAEYSDGSVRDVTHMVRYSSNVSAIASASEAGVVTAESQGETAIMVRTMGLAAAVELMVVKDPPMAHYPTVSRNNYIDEHVFGKLRLMNLVPSGLSSDEEFLRRVYLDVLGTLPSLEETRDFLASHDPEKRRRLIDALLDRPERADVWAMRFADMFRAGYNEAGQKGGGAYYRWFRDQVRHDVAYDQMVRALLVSQGRHDFEGISNFYFVSREIDPEESAVNVSQLLLGVQIECARCHNHPFEKWTQDDFYGFAAFFARVERKDMYLNNHNATYLKDTGQVVHPKTKKVMQPKYLDGPLETEAPGGDVRYKLARWVTSPRNPFFAKATVNRVWKFYMGRGLVEPVDDFRVTNPSTNDALLDALAADFIENGYSLKKLERRILSSRAYQLSSEPNETNRTDQTNYSHFLVRRLMAEQIVDGMTDVTGVAEKFPSFPLGTRAMSIGVLSFAKPHYMMKVFGRNDLREVICERDTKPSIAQVMDLVSGDTIQHQVTATGGSLDRWLTDPVLSDRELVSRVYLSALQRPPAPEEVEAALAPLRSASDSDRAAQRRQAFQDLLWAVFNSKEFLFQH